MPTHLRKFKNNLKTALDYPSDSEFNADEPPCPRCDTILQFVGHDENGDFPLGEGMWECASCGFKISESDVWNAH